ncbi:MAG: FHA domain-containing protein, partial [Limisphaerales bacterium]
MLQLHVTDERGVVTCCIAETFPFRIGRSAGADLQISSAGVWEEHACIRLSAREGARDEHFIIESVGQSLVSINGQMTPSKVISIGDEISLGAARLVVSLAPARQSKLVWHESLVWAILLLIVALEAFVVYFAE